MKKAISCFIALLIVVCMSSFHALAANSENSNEVSLDDNETKVSEVMTFDEMADCIAEDTGIAKDEAIKILLQNPSYSVNSLSIATPMAATYRTLSKSIEVTSVYKPTVNFYCQTSEASTMAGIRYIEYAYINRGYNGISKQFGGTFWYKLSDINNIFFIVNGDWYNNGTTTYTGGVSIGVGGYATINFTVSYSTNHYKYTCIEDTLRWGH
ncbi:hypothetical protein [Traorella massiliensis]|uniref:hypothetical protein n=1 Tax=Traorella massiliensis TaxID=1903263 RepID=UPI00093FF8AD|nr:hypothetical protein [Traorella massiliensis]